MLNIHIWTHCDTFHCKKTTYVSHVNGKGDRGYAREIQAVCNNRKSWFFKCHSFLTIWYKLEITECEHQYGHENYAECEFLVYVSTDATADAAYCSRIAAFILIPEESEPKIWMHINHCLSSVKAMQIQEEQDKSSDIEQQQPFGDRKIRNIQPQNRGGVKTNRNIIYFWQSMKRCTRRPFRKIIPHQGC